MNAPKKRHLKKISVMLAGIICCALLLFPPKEVKGYDKLDEIEITVGYYGMKEYTKTIVSLDDLEEMFGASQEIYTWISNGNQPGTTEAEGIYVSDLMDYAGIDMNSVYTYNFFPQDAATYQNAALQWTNEQLFGTRYTYRQVFEDACAEYELDHDDYLRNPESHFTIDDIFDAGGTNAYTDAAWNSRQVVAPMIALRMKAKSWRNYAPASDLDFSDLQETGKPILVFGQAGTKDITRNAMVQMISKIHVWFAGTPEIVVDSQDLDGEVGTTGKVGVSVVTPDEALTAGILQEIHFVSSDESLATVDEQGNIEIKGEGTAQISVQYGDQIIGTVGTVGHVTQEDTEEPTDPSDPEEPDTEPEQPDPAQQQEEPEQPDDSEDPQEEPQKEVPGNGDGEGTGDGDDGSGGGSGNTDGQGDNAGENGGGNSDTGNGKSQSGGSDGKDESGLSKTKSGGNDSGEEKKITVSPSPPDTKKTILPASGRASGLTDRERQNAIAAERAGAAGDTGGGASEETIANKNRVYEFAPVEAVDTVLAESVIDNRLLRRALFAGLIAMAIGISLESWKYKNQTRWVKRAKRIYEKR